MINYLGNKQLLDFSKTAFLASTTIPTDMVLSCYDWAQKVSRSNECIISGFSSHLEEQVLHFLLKGTCPIILVLARQMYKKIPQDLQPLIDNGRLLIISTSNSSRQSRITAFTRNHYICENADKIVLIADNESSLFQFNSEFNNKIIPL